MGHGMKLRVQSVIQYIPELEQTTPTFHFQQIFLVTLIPDPY